MVSHNTRRGVTSSTTPNVIRHRPWNRKKSPAQLRSIQVGQRKTPLSKSRRTDTMSSPSTIDTLLRLVPDHAARVLAHLANDAPTATILAATPDANGYTLLHAAASYAQLDLLRALVRSYDADVNTVDAEGETPLFYAETVAAARCLVEELHADEAVRNEDGVSAEENARANAADGDGGEWDAVARFLSSRRTGTADVSPAPGVEQGAAEREGVHAPPPLPEGVQINMETVQDAADGEEGAPDPEFRRRIEELAARDDFQGEEGQAELRKLVSEAIGGMTNAAGTESKRGKVE
ncbi:hypothetical protein FH972_022267 [Carpinus fangiana]|uniref:Uncharacterized protein n=1 Tax=Carpinus fangiana TaxID=176857 RepID=A0A5N6KSD5_9ROSI|nr:hypothetical protein FH972_022267 [Carpinus fangiana]